MKQQLRETGAKDRAHCAGSSGGSRNTRHTKIEGAQTVGPSKKKFSSAPDPSSPKPEPHRCTEKPRAQELMGLLCWEWIWAETGRLRIIEALGAHSLMEVDALKTGVCDTYLRHTQTNNQANQQTLTFKTRDSRLRPLPSLCLFRSLVSSLPFSISPTSSLHRREAASRILH